MAAKAKMNPAAELLESYDVLRGKLATLERFLPDFAVISFTVLPLTGQTAGVQDADGHFPTGSLNALIEQRLRGFSELLRSFRGERREPSRTSSLNADDGSSWPCEF